MAEAPSAAEVLARAGGENFPVASILSPRELRPHLMSVYGFARLVDQVGDEVGDSPAERLRLLDWVNGELDTVYRGAAPSHPLLRRLAWTIERFEIPRPPFDRLVAANRQDQTVTRYATFQYLLAYCDLSANPVGELVLYLCRAATPERIALSDATCTALQLVEFWQDLGEDATRGRVYLPGEDIARFGYDEGRLLRGEADDDFRALMSFEAERTRGLLEAGRPLGRTIPGRMGLAVRMFTAGGFAALDDLCRREFDTLSGNAHASRTRRAAFAARELTGWGSRGSRAVGNGGSMSVGNGGSRGVATRSASDAVADPLASDAATESPHRRRQT
jgi:squalene synthase HpnC